MLPVENYGKEIGASRILTRAFISLFSKENVLCITITVPIYIHINKMVRFKV